jgi:DNA-binding NarL/FixJ family response regulator
LGVTRTIPHPAGGGIDASSDSVAPVADSRQFRIAAMRRSLGAATLIGVLRCLIVDDNASFLDAATTLLEREGMTVAGVASTTTEALRRARELRPDVILVDMMLGTDSGLDLARHLAETGLGTTVILISTHAEADFADLIAQTPAAGFVPKSELSGGVLRQLVSESREM